MHRSASQAIHGESGRGTGHLWNETCLLIAVHIALAPHEGTRRALTYGAELLAKARNIWSQGQVEIAKPREERPVPHTGSQGGARLNPAYRDLRTSA